MEDKPRIRVNKHGPILNDGFANVVAGLGAASSKTAMGGYTVAFDPIIADNAFRTSTWYGKILTIPVDDAVRCWRSWLAAENEIELLEKEEVRLQYRNKVREALMIARHEGGALVVVGGLPGSNQSPLNLDQVKKDSITYINVLSRDEVTAGTIIRSPLSPYYGKPEYWNIRAENGVQVQIHTSRVFPINGRQVPGGNTRRTDFWGDSIWLHLADAVMAADSGAAIVSSLLHEAKLDVVSIPDMANILASPQGEQTLINRWQVAAQLRSIASVLLIDGGPQSLEGSAQEEKWQQKQIRWDGLPDVIRILLTVLSGAADIPYTRLTGDQQKGLSNNDDGSLRNYYSSVNTRQELEIEPMLRPLDELLIRSALGSRPDGIWYKWNSLFQITDVEAAALDKTQAETAQIMANIGLIEHDPLAKVVVNRMVETGRWPGLKTSDTEDEPEPLEVPANDPAAPKRGAATPTAPTPVRAVGDTSSALPGLADAAPRTLYVRRDVLNAGEILKHYASQGVTDMMKADDLHVTVIYSKTHVDWMEVPESWASELKVAAGGPRLMDRFGPTGEAKVLLFRCSELEWRHTQLLDIGATTDFPKYQPHITISYKEMPEDVTPWQGEIILGPEIFEEVNENWVEGKK